MRIERDRGVSFLKDRDRLPLVHRRKVGEKRIQRIPRLEILEKHPNGNAGSGDDRSATKDLRIHDIRGGFHVVTFHSILWPTTQIGRENH